MRPRRELGLAILIMLALLVLVARLGREQNREPGGDPRRSTYVTAPAGAHGFATALEQLGVDVVRLRQRLPRLDAMELATDSTVVAAIGPTSPLDAADATALATMAGAGLDLLLAGREAEAGMRCFGYGVRPKLRAEAAASVEAGWPSYVLDVHAFLRETTGDSTSCAALPVARVDTLLRTADGEAAALRLELASGARATLVADDAIFSNRVLRASPGAPFALRLVVGRYQRLLVDEYDHGFGPSGRLDRAVLAWIRNTPWGWAGCQLAVVGLLVLLASGARFGPVRRVIERRRRSPLEHVRALATALAAAGGHEIAVQLLVQGLQRRLARGTVGGAASAADRADPAAWLMAIAPRLRTTGARDAADTLLSLMRRPISAAGVLEAAELVETIWSDLTSASSRAMSSARPA